MKVLLDECVNPRLRSILDQHTVSTVLERGWKGIKNGELLTLAEQEFDVFITLDRNLEFQQRLESLAMAVLVVRIPSNQIDEYEQVAVELLEAVAKLLPGQVGHVYHPEFMDSGS